MLPVWRVFLAGSLWGSAAAAIAAAATATTTAAEAGSAVVEEEPQEPLWEARLGWGGQSSALVYVEEQ